MEFFRERGRLPFDDELSSADDVVGVFGSIRKAFRVVLTVTSSEEWHAIAEDRREDLLVYLALAQFDSRPAFGQLPLALQRDVKALFSNYKKTCAEADELLFSLGKPGVVASSCQSSNIGKQTATALYVHESALTALSSVLRLYEGCARGYLGRVEGANVIKIYKNESMISYLSYPAFEGDPHPTLTFSITVHLQTFRVRNRNYGSAPIRAILHRKELLVLPEHSKP